VINFVNFSFDLLTARSDVGRTRQEGDGDRRQARYKARETSSEESRKKGKGKEKKASSHKSHRSADKKKKMRKVVYYETDTSSPSTSGSDAPSELLSAMSARSLVRSPYTILVLLDILHYFSFH
jgi:hypothetical protein